jgi:hypothetical protein
LEEENSDEFDRTLRILAALKVSIARDAQMTANEESPTACDQYFWQSMFLACITSPTRRPGGLAYLIRNLPHLGPVNVSNGAHKQANGSSDAVSQMERLDKAIEAVASPEPGLLIRCFCAGLRDEQPLIQRGFLDLLVTHLPLSSLVLQEKVVPSDLEKLVIAATSVVARKDMSLNRRLWSWFLGPEIPMEINGDSENNASHAKGNQTPTHSVPDLQTRHFEKFGLQSLIHGISSMITKDSDNPGERTRALRICLSLMDRWEIGGLVIPRIFSAAMQDVWQYQNKPVSKESRFEVLRSANMFFDGVESSLIWSELFQMITQALNSQETSSQKACDMLKMVTFIATNFNIREEEMQTVHMPLVVLAILLYTQQILSRVGSVPQFGRDNLIYHALKIASKLLELVPPRALSGAKNTNDDVLNETALSSEAVISSIQGFYLKDKGSINVGRPFSEAHTGTLILNGVFTLATSMIKIGSPNSHAELEYVIALLKTSIRKVPDVRPDVDDFTNLLLEGFEELSSQEIHIEQPFAITIAKVSIIEAILSTPQSLTWVSPQTLRGVFPSLVRELWPALSVSRPKHNVEAARSIWILYSICEDRQLIDSTIVTLMTQNSTHSQNDFIDEESARKFATLWAHSQSTVSLTGGRRSSLVKNRPDMGQLAESALEISFLERPLMLVLDTLNDSKSLLFPFTINWLQSLNNPLPYVTLRKGRGHC